MGYLVGQLVGDAVGDEVGGVGYCVGAAVGMGTHMNAAVSPCVHWPAGQALHEVCLGKCWYLPDGHSGQMVTAVVSEYDPKPHILHVLADDSWNLPTGQSTHDVDNTSA